VLRGADVVGVRSDLEEVFLQHFTLTYPHEQPPAREFYFARPLRRWRFDFAWPKERVAVEIEGGHWTNGRHTRGSGFRDDCEKYSEAAIRGWCVIRATADMVRSGYASDLAMTALNEARKPVLRLVVPEQPTKKTRGKK
jgi:hypothetical protein